MIRLSLEKRKNELFKAYSRFKSYVYYDNFNMALRSKLSSYESDGKVAEKLALLSKELYDYSYGKPLSERIKKLIQESSYISVPKTFSESDSSQRKSTLIFSNKTTEKYVVEKQTYLFDGAIDLYLISTLWIIEEGISLADIIGKDSYGYHLHLTEDGKRFSTDKLLFSKYFEKYQEWRDRGIKAAKEQIESGNDVLLMSLDIKNFFHSVGINFSELRKDIGINGEYSLTHLIEKIHVHYSSLIVARKNDEMPILPIALPSSGVIANWFLSSFDKEIKDKIAPIYYGRYVDDIFIVNSNITPPENLKDHEGEEGSEKVIDWLIKRFFHEGVPLKKKKYGKKIELEFSDDKYQGLIIQPSKLRLFYFSPDWPLAMLNKFEKTIAENSSAFWFLPEEENMKDSLDDDAYDMHYEDTINKFRSISDVKASKYGASVFLAKRIKLAILNSHIDGDDIPKQIFRFFNGIAILSLHNLWEKVITYFVVTNDSENLIKFLNILLSSLDSIDVKKGIKKKAVINGLYRHFKSSLSISLTLNPEVIAELKNLKWKSRDDFEEVTQGTLNYRKSLLLRHHYLPLPSLIITDYLVTSDGSLLSSRLFKNLIKRKNLVRNNEIENEVWRIPRWLYFQEFCMYLMLKSLSEVELDSTVFTKNQSTEKRQFDEIIVSEGLKLYSHYNGGKDISHIVSATKYKAYVNSDKNDKDSIKIYSNQVKLVSKEKFENPKIGITNMKLFGHEILEAISKESFSGPEKRNRHMKLLNEAEIEKVDLLLLPETSVPLEFLYAYSDEARRKNRAFVFGLEHFTLDDTCYNVTMTILPFSIGDMTDVLILPRVKNHYSPSEKWEIGRVSKTFPQFRPHIYHLYKWRGLQFTVYNCYELTDVVQRSIFRSELDILFAIEYNKDVNYFSNIAESATRDLHCFYVQANSSDYGDSRVVQPKKTMFMNPVRVKGGDNNVILTTTLDVKGLRKFQSQPITHQRDSEEYKITPPDFDHENPKMRGSS